MTPCCEQETRVGTRGLTPRPLLDVLNLFTQLFDFNFDFDCRLADTDAEFVQPGRF